MVVKAVETRLDIALHEPLCAGKRTLNLYQRGVAAFSGAEPMRYIRKNRFINAFQNHSDYFLHEFVIPGWNAKRPLFRRVILLGNIGAAGRVRAVRVVFQ
jgi:hypothetical protein